MKRIALAAAFILSGVVHGQDALNGKITLPAGTLPEFIVIGELRGENKVLTIYRPTSIRMIRQQKKLLPVGDKKEEFKQNEIVRRVAWRAEATTIDSYRLLRADGTELRDIGALKDAEGKLAVIVSTPDAIDPAYLKMLAADTLILQSTLGSEKWTVPAK